MHPSSFEIIGRANFSASSEEISCRAGALGGTTHTRALFNHLVDKNSRIAEKIEALRGGRIAVLMGGRVDTNIQSNRF